MDKYLKILFVSFFVVTIFFYLSVLISPEKFWIASILSFGIFPVIIINITLCIITLLLKRKYVVWPLLGVALGIFFIRLSFHLQLRSKPDVSSDIIKILSINADFFQSSFNDNQHSTKLIEYLLEDSSDVICIQEYRSNNMQSTINITESFSSKGYNNYIYNFLKSDSIEMGLAIFCRYPIISQGEIIFDRDSKNNCIYIDFKMNDDTIRVYNVHLSSMSIPKLNKQYILRYYNYLKEVFTKLKFGAIRHNHEIENLLSHADQCPFALIICGDFNEVPYSYNYLKMRNHFINSFEAAGNGFGFTFNGRLFFLRIDHHFVSDGINPITLRVDRNIKQSGHFPLKGTYQID